jgi:hypothetical protein
MVERDLSTKLAIINDPRKVEVEISRVDRAKFGGPDWNAWAISVTERFDCCVELDIMIGRATADIIMKMLAAGKPAYLYMLNLPSPIGIFRKITEVASINPEDWQSGWMVVTQQMNHYLQGRR